MRELLLPAWCIVFVAWLVVLIMWLRALVEYAKGHRQYEQRHGKPYQGPSERNKPTRLLIQLLRRLGVLLGNANLQNRPGKMGSMAINRRRLDEVKNLSR